MTTWCVLAHLISAPDFKKWLPEDHTWPDMTLLLSLQRLCEQQSVVWLWVMVLNPYHPTWARQRSDRQTWTAKLNLLVKTDLNLCSHIKGSSDVAVLCIYHQRNNRYQQELVWKALDWGGEWSSKKFFFLFFFFSLTGTWDKPVDLEFWCLCENCWCCAGIL